MLLLVWWQVGNTSQNNMEVYCSEAVSSVGPWQGGIHCPSVPVSGPASYNHLLKKYCNYLCPVFHIGNKFSKKGKFLISHCVPVTNTKPKEVNLFIYLLFTYLAHLFLPNKNLENWIAILNYTCFLRIPSRCLLLLQMSMWSWKFPFFTLKKYRCEELL